MVISSPFASAKLAIVIRWATVISFLTKFIIYLHPVLVLRTSDEGILAILTFVNRCYPGLNHAEISDGRLNVAGTTVESPTLRGDDRVRGRQKHIMAGTIGRLLPREVVGMRDIADVVPGHAIVRDAAQVVSPVQSPDQDEIGESRIAN